MYLFLLAQLPDIENFFHSFRLFLPGIIFNSMLWNEWLRETSCYIRLFLFFSAIILFILCRLWAMMWNCGITTQVGKLGHKDWKVVRVFLDHSKHCLFSCFLLSNLEDLKRHPCVLFPQNSHLVISSTRILET